MNQKALLSIFTGLAAIRLASLPRGGSANIAVQDLVRDLKKYNRAYRKGTPLVTDEEYDTIIENLKRLDPDNAWLKKVEPELVRGPKVYHDPPMLSIQKVYQTKRLKQWLKDVDSTGTGTGYDTIVITPKLDGIAVDWTNGILSTRGNGKYGNNISHLVSQGLEFAPPSAKKEHFRGELVVSMSYFQEHLKTKENDHPRNFVAGLANAKTLSKEKKEALKDGAVRVVSFKAFKPDQRRTCPLTPENISYIVDNIEDIYHELISSVDYLCDGVVLSVAAKHSKLRERMGSTSSHNRWQLAYKIQGKAKPTKVTGVTWSPGRFGTLTPVLELDPVFVGANVSRVSAHNLGYYRKKKVGPGAMVSILRSGEIIPYIAKVNKQSKTTPHPENCPYCGTPTVVKKDDLLCPNPDCRGTGMKKLLRFFERLNIKGFGKKTLYKLVDAGYTRASQILDLTAADLQGIGFGPKTSKNLAAEITRTFDKGVDENYFLSAFGIPHLGRSESTKLLEEYPGITGVQNLKVADLRKLHGVGAKTSQEMFDGIQEVWPQVQRVMKHDFVFNSPVAASIAEDALTVLFTGTMDFGSRKKMQDYAKTHGFKPASSFNKDLDILVIGESPGKSKVSKAQKLGTRVVTEAEFIELVEKR